MIDYEVGDIVIGISEDKSIFGKLYKVLTLDNRSDHSTPYLREVKTGGTEAGWWASRFRKYEEGDELCCRFCKSKCKKEEPCGFHQPMWDEIS